MSNWERSHGRKVRGAKVRSSRDEKRSRTRDAGRSTGDDVQTPARTARRTAGADGGGESAAVLDEVPTDQPFVSTDATDAVRERVNRWLSADRPVHLIGPTGCGKTAMAMAVARARDRPVAFINGDEALTTADLIGEYGEQERTAVRDRYVHNVMKSTDVVRDRWVDNPLTVAVREGATLVYNEFSRTKPVANNVLLSVFEEGVLELPGRRGADRYVDVHPEFRAILTSNSSEYAGVHTPQDALLDRLVGIHMDFYDRTTEIAIVRAHVDLPTDTVERVVDVLRRLRGTLDITVGTRAMVMSAEGLATMDVTTPEDALLTEIIVDVLSSKVPDRTAVAELETAVDDAVAR